MLTRQDYEEGQVVLIDKPRTWTSFDVIRRMRKITGVKKVGHAGTLDPLATGLLIVCTGRFTKKINEYMAQVKEYTGTITLGSTTPTFDLESEPENFLPTESINAESVIAATAQFTGAILQHPPIHSAIKKDGQRLYTLARQGIEVKTEARQVTVYEFEIVMVDMPVVSFRILCSTGTYIRSLANDLGAALGCGGYLSSLRRTRIGEFRVEDAIDITEAPSVQGSNQELKG
jgi:tRNA pseudouridine55 synthase